MDADALLPPRCARLFALSDRRPRCAVTLARRLLAALPPDHADYPWAQLTLSWCLVRWDDLPAPVDLLQQAQAALAARGAHWGALTARTALLVAELLQHGAADLLPAWDDLATDWDAAGWPIEAARVRISQVRHLNTLGRSPDARELAETIAPLIVQSGTPADHAALQRFVGTAYLQMGDFPAATAVLAEAEAIFQHLRRPADLAKTWYEHARVAAFQDDFQGALTLYRQAETAFTRLAIPLRIAFCGKTIGMMWVKLGRADRAMTPLLAARTTFSAIGQIYHVTDCTLNLGNVTYYTCRSHIYPGGSDECTVSRP